jgi:two-component system cell cycle sensor histidine kinase/response regulator CckA
MNKEAPAKSLDSSRIAPKDIDLGSSTGDVLSLMPTAVFICDVQGRITFYNPRAAKLWGRKPFLNDDNEKFCGSFRLWSLAGAEIPREQTTMATALKTGSMVLTEEVIIERPDSSKINARITIKTLHDKQGLTTGAIAVFKDTSYWKITEESRQWLGAIIESSDDAIISKNLDGIIMSWNKGAERIFGYQEDEVIGKPVTVLMPPERYNEEPAILAGIRQGERFDHYETVRKRKDGSLIDISLSISPIKDVEGRIIGASKIARDITQRKRMEAALKQAKDALAKSNEELEIQVRQRTAELERTNDSLRREMEEHQKLESQLWQAQKLESIGTLAGGVAHEFNNILNIIKGYALLIRQTPSIGESIAESLNVIDESVERGAYEVKQLLTLARKTESRLTLCNPNDLLLDLAKLLKQTLPKTIELTLDLDSNVPFLALDTNQINQALLNLAVNARDALPNGGELTLKTMVVARSQVPDPDAAAESYLCVELRDNGIGMSSGVRARIFEPFFTTKSAGDGSGLGLAIVYGIIKNHNGFIDVDSKPRHGTTFRLYLPIAAHEEKSTVDDAVPNKALSVVKKTNGAETRPVSQARTKSVLVIEDEENMVYLLRKAFLRNKCGLFVALDGEQAMATFQNHKDDIGVVLLDIGLPKYSGWDIVLRIKEQNPDIKIFVTSGYLEPDIKSKMERAGVEAFIQKPYNPGDIVEMLCNSLEEPVQR